MALTLTNLIAAVRDEVRDPSAVRWSDATITRYLNQGQLELAQMSYQIQVWEISVAAGTASVAAPSGLLFLRQAAWKTASDKYELNIKYGMPRTQPNDQDYSQDLWVVSGQFILDPVPSSAGTLMVAGTVRPTDMVNGTDTPSLMDADNALIAYAVWWCLLSDGDPLADQRERVWEKARTAWFIADAQRNPMQRVLERRPWWW